MNKSPGGAQSDREQRRLNPQHCILIHGKVLITIFFAKKILFHCIHIVAIEQYSHFFIHTDNGHSRLKLFSYPLREEITQAVRRAAEKVQANEIREDDIDEKMIGKYSREIIKYIEKLSLEAPTTYM